MKGLFQAFVFLALASWFAMPSFAQTDITVGFIHRSPEYNWVWNSPNPETEGWPSVGEAISWDACVKNYGPTALTDVAYAWAVNGQIVETGTVDIPADDTVYVHYHTTWSFDRDTLMFVVDSDDAVSEEEEQNNALATYTDAITVGFWVEQTVYDYFHDHQHELAGVHSNSWEDWAQRHVARWNDMLRDAKDFEGSDYDITPNGCLDRIRLDAIHVVPDDALPIGGGSYPGNYPDKSDSTVDLMWGFPVDLVDNGFYDRTTEVSDNNPFYFEGSLFHELGHARYLIDIYGFNVHDKIEWGNIQIMEDGANIVGTSYMPLLAPWYDAVHHQTIRGLMGGDYTYVDEYSAGALNLIAGHRATKGAWNSPGNIGVFMQDLPDENILTLIDSEGDPIPGASVEVYQSKGKAGDWYGKSYVDTPDLTFTSDAEGNVAMGRCPFAIDGHISHTGGISEGVIIVRVEFDGRVEYHFMESMYFNMEYWSGRTDTGYYQIQTDFVARSIVFSNPESGAAWLPDVQKTITWEALGVSSISLHFSSDNGANWTELESSYDASLESYTWTTPNVESNQCKFRAIDLSDGTTAFESDVFSITASGAAAPTIDGALTIEPEWGDPIGINTTDTSLYEPAIREVYAKEGEDHYYFGVLFRRTDCRLNTTLLFDYKTGGPAADALDPDAFHVKYDFPTRPDFFVRKRGHGMATYSRQWNGSSWTTGATVEASDATADVIPGYGNADDTPPYFYEVKIPKTVFSGAEKINLCVWSSFGNSEADPNAMAKCVFYAYPEDPLNETNYAWDPLPGVYTTLGAYHENVFNAIAAPSGLTATATGVGAVRLEWTDNSDDEDGFIIERQTPEQSAFEPIDTVGADATTYDDATVPDVEANYAYRVVAYNAAGGRGESQTANVDLVTFVEDLSVVEEFQVFQNFPNPFNPATTIRFGLPEAAQTKLTIFNALGQQIAVLVDRELRAGWHEATFAPHNLPSGVYVYRVEAGDYTETMRMIYLK